jgi:hypothetical protein
MAQTTAQSTETATRMPLFIAALIGAALVDVALVVRFPYLHGNGAILALALLTPLAIGFVGGAIVSGMAKQMPNWATLATRGALVVLAVVDVIVFAGPLVIGGATAHDTTPQFVAAPTSTSAPATTAQPTTAPAVGPFTFTFNPTPGEGNTTGQAILGTIAGGGQQLRLQGFHTNNGPNLHVFLSHAAQPTTDALVRDGYDLGPLAATEGDKNYPVPATVDLTSIRSVVIYCESFNALFGYASR